MGSEWPDVAYANARCDECSCFLWAGERVVVAGTMHLLHEDCVELWQARGDTPATLDVSPRAKPRKRVRKAKGSP